MVNGLIPYPELIQRTGRTRDQIDYLRKERASLLPAPVRVGSNLFWPVEAVQAVMVLCPELKRA